MYWQPRQIKWWRIRSRTTLLNLGLCKWGKNWLYCSKIYRNIVKFESMTFIRNPGIPKTFIYLLWTSESKKLQVVDCQIQNHKIMSKKHQLIHIYLVRYVCWVGQNKFSWIVKLTTYNLGDQIATSQSIVSSDQSIRFPVVDPQDYFTASLSKLLALDTVC